MDSQEQKNYNIKLPSSTYAVTRISLWNFIKSISKLGTTFTKEQLVNSGQFTKNADAIKRNLAYLKYLNFLNESREVGSDKGTVQKFEVNNSPEVKEMIYQIKAGREDEAKAQLKSMLAKHDLYLFLKNDFFKDYDTRTFVDLENFLRKFLPNNEPGYLQNGGKFIVGLLSDYNLLQVNDQDISLIEKSVRDEMVETGQVIDVGFRNNSLVLDTTRPDEEKTGFLVAIKGPNMNHTIEINTESDLDIVNFILSTIKKKIGIEEK